jgi:hypothetical protein
VPAHISLDDADVPAVVAWLRGVADHDRYDPDAAPDRVARAEALTAQVDLWEEYLTQRSACGSLARLSLALAARGYRHRPGFQERWA